MSDEYIGGQASTEAIAKLEALRQAASSAKPSVFDASNPIARMLFFAFDGTGDNKSNFMATANEPAWRTAA